MLRSHGEARMSSQRSHKWATFAVVILSFHLHPTIRHSHASTKATTKPGIYRIEELTAPEIDALDRRKTLLLLPVGMLEEHGPHLPIASDTYQVNFIVDGMAKRLQQTFPDWYIVVVPDV